MQKKWKLNNKGMTLLEVIVAFAIFAVAATILFAGFNGAFKVIQNSNAIKDASQGSAGELEMKDYTIAPDEKKENVKSIIAKLPEGKILEITGGYFSATKNKSNDQTPITQTLFTAQTLVPKKIPEVPKDSKGVPVVPKRGGEDAYFSHDEAVDWGAFFDNGGNLVASQNDQYYPFADKSQAKFPTYVEKYGLRHKGVVDTLQMYIKKGTVNVPFDTHLEQLFFTQNKPFANKSGYSNEGGDLIYHTKFVYIGADSPATSNEMQITVNFDKNNKVEPDKTTSLIFGSYSGKKTDKTILYLPQKFTIKYQKKDSNWVSVVLNPGFYDLPDGTDILKVAYDQTFYEEFLKYTTTYTKSQLEAMGITAVEQP